MYQGISLFGNPKVAEKNLLTNKAYKINRVCLKESHLWHTEKAFA